MIKPPRILVHDTAVIAAQAAAAKIAQLIAGAHETKDKVTVAFSGGSTPGPMFDTLAVMDLPWQAIHIFQVDERVAPNGSKQTNSTELNSRLLKKVPVPGENVHLMPVQTDNLEQAVHNYEEEVYSIIGSGNGFDVTHLGLGADGHTASMVPGDPVLAVTGRSVAVTGEYQGAKRMTLTLPILNRSRATVWLVAGSDKAEQVARLVRGDTTIPAGRVQGGAHYLFLDHTAASSLGQSE